MSAEEIVVEDTKQEVVVTGMVFFFESPGKVASNRITRQLIE